VRQAGEVEGDRSVKHRSRHIITAVSILLLLGAIVNVAVAWGLSLRSWPYAQRFGFQHAQAPDQSAINWWRSYAVAGFPDRPATMHTLRRFGYRSLALYDQATMQASVCFAYAAAHGWPMVSLESQHWVTRSASDQFRALTLSGWPLSVQSQRELPIVPVWPGFAVNTILYGGVIWLIVASTAAIRSRRRLKRGLCPKCAYPVGESEECTECGAILRPGPA
jgi:hypothetical protein